MLLIKIIYGGAFPAKALNIPCHERMEVEEIGINHFYLINLVSKLPGASKNGHSDLQLKRGRRKETIYHQQNKGSSPNFDSNVKRI